MDKGEMVTFSGASKAAVVGGCENCHRCLDGVLDPANGNFPVTSSRMILCPACGNKRCPKASDHALSCSGSNEPGQKGSVYS
jgi:hypothetical protein